MKKIINILLTMNMLLLLFTGCSQEEKKEEDDINVVVTIYPLYDWTKNLSKDIDNINIEQLVSLNTDMHSYQPTAKDIVKLSTCDVLIFVGGESDEWVEDALKQVTNKDMVVIDAMDVLEDRLFIEETKEGMEKEEEEEDEYDEHIWLSLKNAEIVCKEISDTLIKVNASNSEKYKNNLDNYLAELNNLDKEYKSYIDQTTTKTLLVADRFPFRYLCEDYGLDYFAAFKGCSAETEASFETIKFLSAKVDELGLNSILCIEGSNNKIAKTVVENTKDKNQKILVLNSIQSQIGENDTYLAIMEYNLNILKEALN